MDLKIFEGIDMCELLWICLPYAAMYVCACFYLISKFGKAWQKIIAWLNPSTLYIGLLNIRMEKGNYVILAYNYDI